MSSNCTAAACENNENTIICVSASALTDTVLLKNGVCATITSLYSTVSARLCLLCQYLAPTVAAIVAHIRAQHCLSTEIRYSGDDAEEIKQGSMKVSDTNLRFKSSKPVSRNNTLIVTNPAALSIKTNSTTEIVDAISFSTSSEKQRIRSIVKRRSSPPTVANRTTSRYNVIRVIPAKSVRSSVVKSSSTSTGSNKPAGDDADRVAKGPDAERHVFLCAVCGAAFDCHNSCKQHVSSVHTSRAEASPTVQGQKEVDPDSTEAGDDDTRRDTGVIVGGVDSPDVSCRADETCDHIDEQAPMSPLQDWCKVERNLVCRQPGCTVRFSSESNRRQHELCHDHAETSGLRCPHCPALSEVSWPRLATHLWRVHRLDVDMYRCERCSFRCSLSANLLKHRRHRHNADGDCRTRWRHVCGVCGRRFQRDSQLHEHRVTKCTAESSTASDAAVSKLPGWCHSLLCTPCGRVFSSRAALLQHRRSRHDNVRGHCCPVCSHTAATRHLLQLHMRGHSVHRPHVCSSPGCSFTTRDPSSLKKHQLRHTDVRPYRCSQCDYACIQTAALKAHYRRHHSGCSDSGLWQCQQCPFSTVNSGLYRQHLADHKNGLVLTGSRTIVGCDRSDVVSPSSAGGSTVAGGGFNATTGVSRSSSEMADGCNSSVNKCNGDQYVFQIVPDKPTEDRGGVSIPAGLEHSTLLSDYLSDKEKRESVAL